MILILTILAKVYRNPWTVCEIEIVDSTEKEQIHRIIDRLIFSTLLNKKACVWHANDISVDYSTFTLMYRYG